MLTKHEDYSLVHCFLPLQNGGCIKVLQMYKSTQLNIPAVIRTLDYSFVTVFQHQMIQGRTYFRVHPKPMNCHMFSKIGM